MRGDFSQLRYSPLDNDQGVLYQQGRVTLDTDHTAAELIALHWRSQAARDVIGARVAAVPANEPDGFAIVSAAVTGGQVHVQVRPGRVWADGLLLYLPGDPASPGAPVDRIATYLEPPLDDGTVASIGANVRDAVILEVALEELNGFQDPQRLIEAALGGPDTTERVAARYAFRLVRLGPGQDCSAILPEITDGPANKGRLSVTLDAPVVVAGDCPTVDGGGYTGLEHNLYRVEVAAVNSGAPRIKWSQFNGGLVGRGIFQAGTPSRVVITANRAAIVNSNLTEFYLEALAFDAARGHWSVVYGAQATLNSQLDLELNASPIFGTFSFGTEPVFFRLWNGIEPISGFTSAPSPLLDGINLEFDAPGAAATYRPGDYWTFSVRAGEIENEEVLIDQQPPAGPVLRRVPLAEINWTAAQDTTQAGFIEDCRRRFRPLTNQKVCCSLLVGDGLHSFGDFNSLEEAAAHLPPAGGELCLLPGVHFANLTLVAQHNIRIQGCPRRTLVLPRSKTPAEPIFHLLDCTGIQISGLDLVSFFGAVVVAEGTAYDDLRDLGVVDCRMVARTFAVQVRRAQNVVIARNLIWLLDTSQGRAAIQVRAHRARIERNALGVWPVDFAPPTDGEGDGGNGRKPSDPCADPEDVYGNLTYSIDYVKFAWLAQLAVQPQQPYRAWGGIHLLGGCDEVKVVENRVDGGAGHGITLGGLLPGEPPTPASLDTAQLPGVVVVGDEFVGLVRDESDQPVTGVDIYLRTGTTVVGQDVSKGAQAQVNIKAAPGSYTLAPETGYEIVSIALADTGATRIHLLTVRVADVQVPEEQGFLYDVSIRGNEVLRMALSGIGFLRYGAPTPAPAPPGSNDPAAVAAFLATTFAPRLLIGATNVVRDLTVAENRLHQNLRAVFTDELRKEAREIGQGGISLGLVENGRITGNQVLANGTSAVNPTCGIFVGYAENLEIADNEITGNGPVHEDYETDRIEGLRGGIYVRFASALLVGGETDAQQKPAVRITGNRVDQPAGPAVTVFAFGPVACTNNYLNSEHTGRLNLLDQMAGGVLILNLGGLHRQQRFAQVSNNVADFSSALVAELLLPGGEVLFNDNQVRMGTEHRAIACTFILTLDDLGYDGNQSSVFRPDLLLSNGICLGFSLRTIGNRFREHTENCFFSLLTYSFGMTPAARLLTMNTTALNQGDHCILALSNARRPPDAAPHGPPVVDQGNMEANFTECRRALGNSAGRNEVVLQALAATLFGQQTIDTTRASATGKLATVSATRSVYDSQMQYRASYQGEATRLAYVQGTDSMRAQQAKMRLERSSAAIDQLGVEAELATIQEATAPAQGAVWDGRIMDASQRGRGDVTVELVRADDSTVGVSSRTDAAGYYAVQLDASQARKLEQEQLFIRVSDAQGNVLHRSRQPVTIKAEQRARSAVTLSTAAIPQEQLRDATVIYRKRAETGRSTPLEHVKGIGPVTAAKLREAGIADVEALLRTSGDVLVDIAGFDADVVRRSAEHALEDVERAPAEPPAETDAKAAGRRTPAKRSRRRRKSED